MRLLYRRWYGYEAAVQTLVWLWGCCTDIGMAMRHLVHCLSLHTGSKTQPIHLYTGPTGAWVLLIETQPIHLYTGPTGAWVLLIGSADVFKWSCFWFFNLSTLNLIWVWHLITIIISHFYASPEGIIVIIAIIQWSYENRKLTTCKQQEVNNM